MYLSKESLKKIYSKLNSLYPQKMETGTTFVSALRYFLATDEFKKNKGHSCDTNEKDDREEFVKYVGHVVLLSKQNETISLYTKNFANLLGTEKDYKVQSNFFTVGQVKISEATKKAVPYPSGSEDKAILVCDDGKVDIAENGYQVFAEKYLQNDFLKFTLLFVWLNRYTNFNSRDAIYEDFLNELQKKYTESLCKILQWSSENVKQFFERMISEYTFEEVCSYLEKDDIVDDELTMLLKNLEPLLNDELNKNKFKEFLKMLDLKESEGREDESDSNSKKNYSQIIYYGVPGCGKSNKIKEDLKNVPEYNKIRVVFHPEYTNADFIGQILPEVHINAENKSVVEYKFKPGPFTEIIRRAYLNPNEKFYLVIEEINRGNAAAIFGDAFQLLDRIKSGEDSSTGNVYKKNWSKYGVDNVDVNAYIRKIDLLKEDKKTTDNDGSLKKAYATLVEGVLPQDVREPQYYASLSIPFADTTIHITANTAIRLPPNLSILATMNTSDQNVFTLDNAFQRRFDMQLVRNEFEKDESQNQFGGYKDADVQKQHDATIADTNVKWGDFWEWINKKIVTTLKGLSSTEDKRLGVWFVSNVDGKIDEKVFAEKVLKYLWDDAFKFKRPQIFALEIDTLERLIAAFEKPDSGKNRFEVFKDFSNLMSSVAASPQNNGAANS